MEDLERMIKNPESQEIQLIRRNFHNRKGNSLIGCPIALAGFLASVTLPAVNGYNVARGNQTVNPIAFLPGPVLGLASGIDPTIPREVPFISAGIYTAIEVLSYGIGYWYGSY